MNAKDFLQAMNEIDQKYIKQADIFAPAAPAKAPVIFRVLRWAGAAAACVLVAGGLWLMWDLGLLADINEVPASQGAEDTRNIQPGEPTPLSELPALEFPTREEVGYRGGEAVGCGTELTAVSLTQKQIAAIWGQEESLAWEGLYLTGPYAGYHSNATAFYDEDGKLSYLSLEVKKNSTLSPECSFTVEIAPGHINSLGSHMTGPPSRTCDVWGTEVTTLAGYNNDENFAGLSISFLTGPEGEEGTLGVTAKSMIWESAYSGWTLEDGEELLTRLASQCLRPGNTFQLSHLEQAPQLTFPEPAAVEDIYAYTGWEAPSGCETMTLTLQQTASIFGMENLFWDEEFPDPGFQADALLFHDGSGTVTMVLLNFYPLDDLLDPVFSIVLYPADREPGFSIRGGLEHSCEMFGTEVLTGAGKLGVGQKDADWNDNHHHVGTTYRAEFVRESPEPVGVLAQAFDWDEDSLDSETVMTFFNRFAAQCLNPEYTLQLSQLDQEMHSVMEESQTAMNVSISPDGRQSYDSPEYQAVYEGFRKELSVTSDDPASAASRAGDESCTQVVTILCPKILGTYEAPGENGETDTKVLCSLYEVDYGFFEKDSKKAVRPVSGFADLASLTGSGPYRADGFFEAEDVWFPKDGSDYLSSVSSFILLDEVGEEDEAKKMVQQSRLWLEPAQKLAMDLLASYMEQNGMTGYSLWDVDTQSYQPFPPNQQDGQEIDLESAAAEVAQEYANSWLSMSEPGYPPLAECFYTDLNWAESPDSDSDIQVSCRMVFRLENPDGGLGNWSAGNTKPGTGEYEGYYTAFRFIYAKQENGRWVITGSGTGP